MISFGSDNHAGIHPLVIEAIAAANSGFTPAYGGDPWTEMLRGTLKSEFGPHAIGVPVFNGTGANVVAYASCLKRYEGAIVAEKSHVDVDECGAPERVGGFKLLTVPTKDQKLTPAKIREKLARRGDTHAIQPRMISITNSTELGTVYSIAELKALGDFARAEGLLFHVDGARLANAAVSLGCSLKECTTDVGVDVLSFGGTKNGLLGVEAVIGLSERFVRDYGEDLRYTHKQSMQLASKMRFFSTQLLALFDGGKGKELWRRNATHANAMASLLLSEVAKLAKSGLTLTQEVQANALFVRVPKKIVSPLQSKFSFYTWDESEAENGFVVVRWMTSFQTSESDVRAFVAELARLL
ncbi:MAG: threonine aldolase [Bdellovibrionales bacterium]|nr:threonine aldolase [Bdellovibrionales bacterium]